MQLCSLLFEYLIGIILTKCWVTVLCDITYVLYVAFLPVIVILQMKPTVV